MFRKKCPKCEEKISRNFTYCPYCGYELKEEKKRESDGLIDEIDEVLKMPLPFGFGSLFKQIDRQLKELDKEFGKEENIKELSSGISISISSFGGKPTIKVSRLGKPDVEKVIEKREPSKKIKVDTKKFASLPKEEAISRVRRFADKIVYEIELPGVDSPRNIFINRLQNSIEIRAFSKDKAYFKLIPIALPLLKYYLQNQKLFLELKPET